MNTSTKIDWVLKDTSALYGDDVIFEGDTHTAENEHDIYTWTKVAVEPLRQHIPNIPNWLYRLEVDWHERFSNDPEFKCLTLDDSHWDFDDDVKWRYANVPTSGWWYKQHDDGRLQVHKHDGHLGWNSQLPKAAWQTTQQEGYAKRSFHLEMEPNTQGPNGTIFEEGRTRVELRGPWHTGVPVSGFIALSTKPYNKDTCFCFGLKVPTMLIVVAATRDLSDHPLWILTQDHKNKKRGSGRISLAIGKPGDERPKAVRIYIDGWAPWASKDK